MEELFFKILKEYGWGGVFALYAFSQWIQPAWKKKTGRWVSWQELLEKLEMLETRLNDHLGIAREIHEEFKLNKATQVMTNDQFKITVTDMKTDIKDIFKLISEIKTLLIEKR